MRFLLVALTVGCVAALLATAPFWMDLPINAGRLTAYSAAGAWLQGALTPLLLGVAILSFWLQRTSTAAQAKAQGDANDIAAWTFFIDNVDTFAGHLSYRCLCAIYGQQLPGQCNPVGQRLGFQAMPAMFKGFDPVVAGIVPSIQGGETLCLEEMRASEQYAILVKEIDQVISLSRRVRLEGMLDGRIMEVWNLVKQHPPT